MVFDVVSSEYQDYVVSENLRISDFDFDSPDIQSLVELVVPRLDLMNQFLASLAFLLEIGILFAVVSFLIRWLFSLVSDVALGWRK